MRKSTPQKMPSLIGEWRTADPFGSDVRYVITKKRTGYSVAAVCDSDGESAEIFCVKSDEGTSTLMFAAHWASTGRFLKCRLMLVESDKASFTFTYTSTDTLIRQQPKS